MMMMMSIYLSYLPTCPRSSAAAKACVFSSQVTTRKLISEGPRDDARDDDNAVCLHERNDDAPACMTIIIIINV